jgi:CRP/FNR family transcriptional regulator, cyclic AMP receptor protein
MRLSLLHMRALPERLARLRSVSLFATLNPRELGIVAGFLHDREYTPGEVIFDEGEEGQALYVVFTGEVIICRPGHRESGRLAALGPGTFFGDLALLDNAPRAAQAIAATPCHLGVFFRSDFQNVLETDARAATKLYRQLAHLLARRLRETVYGARGEQYL